MSRSVRAPSSQTRLAQVRHWRGASQEELAERVGMAYSSYRKLELGETPNPSLRYLVNCAKALGVPLAAVIEPEWLEWLGDLEAPGSDGFWPPEPETDAAEYGRYTRKPRPMPPWLGPLLHGRRRA